MGPPRHVVVVGGGISGLACAHALRRAEPASSLAVTVVESSERLGGKVHTGELAGHHVDTGPDALMIRSASMHALLEELSLAEAVVEPGVNGAYVWSRTQLRRLPAGTIAGIASHPWALLRSGLLTPAGLARAGLDLVLPRSRARQDPSVSALVGHRFGRQVLARVADPLLGGVYAGSVDQLSAASVVPELAAAAGRSRSLAWSLRRAVTAVPPGPSLVTLRGGLVGLVTRLAAALDGCEVLTGRPVILLEQVGDRYALHLADGRVLDADAVVLAVPAFAAAELLASMSPVASAALSQIPYSDVATVSLSYSPGAVGRPLDGTGFLVPSEEGKLVVGCTWLTVKWPHLADPERVLVRAMVGRHGDRRFVDLDDAKLVGAVHGELSSIMGLSAPPTDSLVQRWPRALPQYTVGHRDRLDRLDTALAEHPGLYTTGAAYRGVGLAGCVEQAERTAQSVLVALQGAAEIEGSAV